MRPDEEKHDPEKLADFSDKIMRPDEEKHDPEKLADFSDKIMRPEKERMIPKSWQTLRIILWSVFRQVDIGSP